MYESQGLVFNMDDPGLHYAIVSYIFV